MWNKKVLLRLPSAAYPVYSMSGLERDTLSCPGVTPVLPGGTSVLFRGSVLPSWFCLDPPRLPFPPAMTEYHPPPLLPNSHDNSTPSSSLPHLIPLARTGLSLSPFPSFPLPSLSYPPASQAGVPLLPFHFPQSGQTRIGIPSLPPPPPPHTPTARTDQERGTPSHLHSTGPGRLCATGGIPLAYTHEDFLV